MLVKIRRRIDLYLEVVLVIIGGALGPGLLLVVVGCRGGVGADGGVVPLVAGTRWPGHSQTSLQTVHVCFLALVFKMTVLPANISTIDNYHTKRNSIKVFCVCAP